MAAGIGQRICTAIREKSDKLTCSAALPPSLPHAEDASLVASDLGLTWSSGDGRSKDGRGRKERGKAEESVSLTQPRRPPGATRRRRDVNNGELLCALPGGGGNGHSDRPKGRPAVWQAGGRGRRMGPRKAGGGGGKAASSLGVGEKLKMGVSRPQ